MEYTVRTATVDDVDAIVHHRCEMMRELQSTTDEVSQQMKENFRPWLLARLGSREYLGWLAVTQDGRVVAGSGLIFLDWPPSMLHLNAARRAYLLNVYTEPEHRKQGLAHRLTQHAIDWCKENDIPVLSLHASKYGRPIYESLGFQDSAEMRMVLK
jgi:GNAT superfamily N-acetyltransferase